MPMICGRETLARAVPSSVSSSIRRQPESTGTTRGCLCARPKPSTVGNHKPRRQITPSEGAPTLAPAPTDVIENAPYSERPSLTERSAAARAACAADQPPITRISLAMKNQRQHPRRPAAICIARLGQGGVELLSNTILDGCPDAGLAILPWPNPSSVRLPTTNSADRARPKHLRFCSIASRSIRRCGSGMRHLRRCHIAPRPRKAQVGLPCACSWSHPARQMRASDGCICPETQVPGQGPYATTAPVGGVTKRGARPDRLHKGLPDHVQSFRCAQNTRMPCKCSRRIPPAPALCSVSSRPAARPPIRW